MPDVQSRRNGGSPPGIALHRTATGPALAGNHTALPVSHFSDPLGHVHFRNPRDLRFRPTDAVSGSPVFCGHEPCERSSEPFARTAPWTPFKRQAAWTATFWPKAEGNLVTHVGTADRESNRSG